MAAPPGDAPLTAANNIQPFFVLHKASAAAASSVPSSRARRRIDASLPSSPNPKSAKRTRDVDAQDEEDSELCERFRLEAFHRIWSRIQSTIDEVLRGINLKLFDQVLQWAQESFSAIRAVAKPEPVEAATSRCSRYGAKVVQEQVMRMAGHHTGKKDNLISN